MLGKNITETDNDAKIIEKDLSSYIRLDLGCGNNKMEGFLGVDISSHTQADFLCDFNKFPWMFSRVMRSENKINVAVIEKITDNSVSEIFCSHYIEHTEDIKSFMEEIYRIVIPKGVVRFIAPYYSSIRAMQDFTHKRFISENTFLYFVKDWIEANKLDHYNINCNFQIESIKYIYGPEWKARAKQAQEFARKYYVNAVEDIDIILRCVK